MGGWQAPARSIKFGSGGSSAHSPALPDVPSAPFSPPAAAPPPFPPMPNVVRLVASGTCTHDGRVLKAMVVQPFARRLTQTDPVQAFEAVGFGAQHV